MNDDELRAFLESATPSEPDENERDDAPADGDEDGSDEAAQGSQHDAEPKRAAPSFDELMGFPPPSASDESAAGESVAGVSAPAPVSAESAESASAAPAAPASAEPAAPAPAESTPVAPAESTPAAPAQPTPAQIPGRTDAADEQLVPLILPGFSSDTRPKRTLPPVFQSDTGETKADKASDVDDLAPTQPFDVIPSAPASAPTSASVPASSPESAPARPQPAVPKPAQPQPAQPQPAVPHPAQPQPAAPQPAAPKPAASKRPQPEPTADTNPFAALSLEPDLALDSDSAHETDSALETDEAEYEKIAVTGSGPRGRKALPWIIVGGGAVIAIIASILVINGVRGSTDTEPTTSPPATSEPATPSPDSDSEPTPTTPEPEPQPDAPPEIDPGDTYPLAITQWGLTVDRSNSFGGSTPYELQEGNTRAMFELPLAQSLPESCAAARTGWGLLRPDESTTLEVIRPEPRCSDDAAAAVYDKIWGLMNHMAKTARAS